ncbi:MAG: TIGR03668 family PPOX class F420-dependent oxidoreductase [Acidimicrobiia bacterium]
MDPTAMRSRLAAARVARLATVRAGGQPHLVPCCFVLLDETVYSAVDAKPKSTFALQRLANIRAHPAVTLLVDHYAEDWSALWWVRVDGRATTIEGRDRDVAVAALQDKYEQYRRYPPPGAVIAIAIESWRGWP